MQQTLCAFLKEPDYFLNLNGLQVLSHATSSDKDPIENKKLKKIESGGQGENDDLFWRLSLSRLPGQMAWKD